MFGLLLSSSTLAQSTGWIENPNHPPVQVKFMLTGELD
ncbi:MAG: suppressor for copper-sensitivity B, partial [Shewanella sp.]